MLIKCPECNNDISDKAVACPRCGFPLQQINTTPTTTKTNTRRPRKFRRLPNGFGSIKHLSGNRRNPYAAYPPTKEWTGTSPKSRPAIGYFRTYNDAYKALAEYNATGIAIENKLVTFAQVYKMFFDEYQTKDVSRSALNAYKNAYKRCASLQDRPFIELRRQDYQAIFDENQHFSIGITNNLRKLFNQMYKVAIENDIVDRNYSANTVMGGKESEKGVPFTIDDIKTIWKHKDNPTAQIVLTLIYTGYRPGELAVIEIREDRFLNGLKTADGRTRVVPIPNIIKEFDFKSLLNNFVYWRFGRAFDELLDELGLSHAKTGEKHTPHDCRHTFSWLADKYKMDNMSKRMIMGHSLGNDVEDSVYGHRTFEELQKEINKITVQ